MSGVGTEIAKQIPAWAARQTKGCGCNDKRKKWDAWGWELCEKRKATIVAALVGQRQYLTPPLNKLPKATVRAGAERIVARAIKRAKQ